MINSGKKFAESLRLYTGTSYFGDDDVIELSIRWQEIDQSKVSKTILWLVDLSLTSMLHHLYESSGKVTQMLPRFDFAMTSILGTAFFFSAANSKRTKQHFKMADSPREFTEAEKRRMEALNKQFALRQKKIAQMKRRNIAIFTCLLASVAGICILWNTNGVLENHSWIPC